MVITEYNEAETMKGFYSDGHSDGLAEGLAEGYDNGVHALALALDLLRAGKTPAEIVASANIAPSIVSIAQKYV